MKLYYFYLQFNKQGTLAQRTLPAPNNCSQRDIIFSNVTDGVLTFSLGCSFAVSSFCCNFKINCLHLGLPVPWICSHFNCKQYLSFLPFKPSQFFEFEESDFDTGCVVWESSSIVVGNCVTLGSGISSSSLSILIISSTSPLTVSFWKINLFDTRQYVRRVLNKCIYLIISVRFYFPLQNSISFYLLYIVS